MFKYCLWVQALDVIILTYILSTGFDRLMQVDRISRIYIHCIDGKKATTNIFTEKTSKFVHKG